MDSQEAANLAQIENTRLSRKLVNIGYATLIVCALGTGFAAWAVLRSPDTSEAPSTGGGFMLIKWLPVIILGFCSLTLAVALFVISFRRWKYGKYESDYKLARTQLNSLKEELATANSTNLKLGRDLESQTRLLESKTQSLETSRREVAEVRGDADAQTRTYDVTFKGMREEMDTLKRELENANKSVAFETSQRDEFIKLYHKAQESLGIWTTVIAEAQAQAANIDNWVVIKQVNARHLRLTKTPRMIIIAIRIRNESIYKITIKPEGVHGRLHFKTVPYREEARMPHDAIQIEDLEPRQTALVLLEQPVTQTEGETIAAAREYGDPNGIFWLGNLHIPISAKNTPEPVDVKRLTISREFEFLNVADFPYDGNT